MKCGALMTHYHKLPETTAKAMTPDGFYRTSDVFRRDENGFFYFVGRVDDMFVCGGENIYPGEVEKMLERHPGIHQAAVMPVPDELKGHKPIAFVVQAPGAALDEQAVKSYALANAPAYQHPRRVLFVDEMPLAGTNKIDKRVLAKQIPPGGEALKMKAAVVREHGGPERLDFEPNFPDPKPGEGDVIVAVKASSLNYHDVFTRRGMPGIKVPMPVIMGLDVAGEIAEVGPGVTRLEEGRPRAGRSDQPRRGRPDGRDRAWRPGRALQGARPPAHRGFPTASPSPMPPRCPSPTARRCA